ncbi:hypothetical protein [Alicyclobacillus mengziensis]|uniref:O-antigen ligase-like membrane protein n=1 Tax=Alicyclobacillus mengziensis TaxID=2931921 RepID=A0A9X7Z3Z2_9BACL|nr:hypothetical protein [Alicyclobacillus mengziensis]QSO45439.1 hypothetical protein JZ786_12705 [Alicyclobacillus mengziensis]
MLARLYYRTWLKPVLLKIALVSIVLGLSLYIGRSVIHPGNIRTLLGLTLIFLTLALSIVKPNASIVFVMMYLPLLGLIRRILIPIAGWGSFDPLVIVAPSVALLTGSYWFYRLLFLREPILNDTPVFKLVRLMVLIDLLEVINPRQGSPMVGISAIIFYVVPLFWMVTARTVVTEKAMKTIIHIVFVMGIIAALYGLKQTYFGFYPFEKEWISIVKITSLHVGNLYRALSTTDNPQGYAEFLAEAICVSWLYVLRGNPLVKIIGLAGTSVIGWALFMESARGPLILAAAAIAVMTVMYGKTTKSKVIFGIIVGAVLAVVILKIFHMHASNNALVQHQIAGITGKNSTLSGHISTALSGIWRGAKSVIGYGLGSTTTAASKFSSSNTGAEVDFSNMFLSDGLAGGIVYLVLMVRMLILGIRAALTRSLVGLFGIGVLVATFEQWVNGELYVVATIVWITIGYIDRISARSGAGASQVSDSSS